MNGPEPEKQEIAALARVDWRDVLVRADLADDDWSYRLDNELGPATA